MKRLWKAVIALVFCSCIGLAAQNRPSQDGLSICGQWFWLGMSTDEVIVRIPNKCGFNKLGDRTIDIFGKGDESDKGMVGLIWFEGGKVSSLERVVENVGGVPVYKIGKSIAEAISAAAEGRKLATATVWIRNDYTIPNGSDMQTVVISFGKRAVVVNFNNFPGVGQNPARSGMDVREVIQVSASKRPVPARNIH